MNIKRLALWIGAGVLALAVLAYGWYRFELRAVNAAQRQAQTFTVAPGDGPTNVAANLSRAKLIHSRLAFLAYVVLHGDRNHLQSGIYSLSPSENTATIADTIAGGRVTVKLLVVPEGKTVAQISKLVPGIGVSTADFLVAAHDGYTGFAAVNRPSGANLEGYLFPDTYQVTPGITAHQLIQIMLSNFDRRLTPDLITAFNNHGLTSFQGVTLASIVQREVGAPADQAVVAQVFLNRLRAGMALESDVTAQYAADQAGVAFSTTLRSPYNTYVVSGLPVGPISNPGLSALTAVAHPTPNNYYYFLAGKDGKTYYARTFAEHQANIRAHL